MDTKRYKKIVGRKLLKLEYIKKLSTHRLLSYYKKKVRRLKHIIFPMDGIRASELFEYPSMSRKEEDQLLDYYEKVKEELNQREHVE